MNNDFCCGFMQTIVERLPSDKSYSTSIPIKYSPVRRLFLLQLCPPYYHRGDQREDNKTLIEGIPIKYCPRCGTKLPKELTTERIKAVKEECGIDLLREREPAEINIPRKFWSDKWWKEKGL